jgi:hypothetical protein
MGNYEEPGIAIEREALANAKARETERPAGKFFVTPPRKIDARAEIGAEIDFPIQ